MRVQGADFYKIKHECVLQTFQISSNGNIKAFLVHTPTNKKITHWLNDTEKEKFLRSNFYRNRQLLYFDSNDNAVYGKKPEVKTSMNIPHLIYQTKAKLRERDYDQQKEYD